MDDRSVFIAVPTRGAVQWQTVTALEQQRDRLGGSTQPPILYQEASLSVALARNRIVKAFKRSGCDVLVMVDDDVAPPANFVELMLPHLDGFGMIALPHASPHPIEHDKMHLTAYREELSTGEYLPVALWGGMNEVDAVATGCAMIPRHVFADTNIGWAPFRISDDPDATIKSDDMLFCRLLDRHGYRVGALWLGQPVDHFRQVSLAPLAQEHLHFDGVAEPAAPLLVVGKV